MGFRRPSISSLAASRPGVLGSSPADWRPLHPEYQQFWVAGHVAQRSPVPRRWASLVSNDSARRGAPPRRSGPGHMV